jgi:N-methylhydantoinase A
MTGLRVATDVGGTFTDLVAFSIDPESGRQEIVTAKSDTTPPDFERGVLDVLGKSGIAYDDIRFLAHGTTLVINAITERTGVRTALITTTGFRDSLEIARGNRPDYFNSTTAPPPFVPRYLRREVPGRPHHDGRERESSTSPACRRSSRTSAARSRGDRDLPPAFVLRPEARAGRARPVRELWPEVSAVASHQITREWREYERTSTVVLSAYVQPVAERYLTRLADGVRGAGFHGQLYVLQSNTGVDTVEKTKRIPITMVESRAAICSRL